MASSEEKADTISPVKPCMCGICREDFESLENLHSHLQTHGIAVNDSLFVCNWSDAIGVDGQGKQFTCMNCNEQFNAICTLHKHICHCFQNDSYLYIGENSLVYPLDNLASFFNVRDVITDNAKELSSELLQIACKEEALNPLVNVFNHLDKNNSGDVYVQRSLFTDDIQKTEEGNDEKSPVTSDAIKELKCKTGMVTQRKIPKQSILVQDKNQVLKCRKRGRPRKIKANPLNSDRNHKYGESETNLNIHSPINDSGIDMCITVNGESLQSNNELDEKQESSKNDISNNGRKLDGTNEMIQSKRKSNKICNKSIDKNNMTSSKKSSLQQMEAGIEDTRDQALNSSTKREQAPNSSIQRDKVPNSSTKREQSPNSSIQGDKMPNSSTKKRGRAKPILQECEVCGEKMFKSRMEKHRAKHSDDRPFKCDMCPKTFKYKGHLTEHRRIHDDVLPFYCEVCGKGFPSISSLNYHSYNHSDVRPFSCEFCGAAFHVRSRLNRHMKRHTGKKSHQCDLCGMRFMNSWNLKIHRSRVHDSERRFACTECDKTFITNYELKCHEMSHTGVRPYKCSMCTADFIQRKELRRHMKIQHNTTLDEKSVSGLFTEHDNIKAMDEDAYLKHEMVITEEIPNSQIDLTGYLLETSSAITNIAVKQETDSNNVLVTQLNQPQLDGVTFI